MWHELGMERTHFLDPFQQADAQNGQTRMLDRKYTTSIGMQHHRTATLANSAVWFHAMANHSSLSDANPSNFR
jgi:hypothetical protein